MREEAVEHLCKLQDIRVMKQTKEYKAIIEIIKDWKIKMHRDKGISLEGQGLHVFEILKALARVKNNDANWWEEGWANS